ncbi:hypothetical protein L209DRAFT_678237, partial [Thermothelomyces heterothallicus CBS 203.75]
IDNSNDNRFNFIDSKDKQEEDTKLLSLSRVKKELLYIAIIKDIRRFKKRCTYKLAIAILGIVILGTEDNNYL